MTYHMHIFFFYSSAHLNCIIEYAKVQSNQNHVDIGMFMLPWEYCSQCKQNYRNKLRLDLAGEVIKFTKEIFPLSERVPSSEFPCDPYRYSEALYVKAKALANYNDDDKAVEIEMNEEGIKVTTEIVSTIDKMREYTPVFPKQITQLEGLAYNQLGMFIIDSITNNEVDKEEVSKRAIKCFEKARENAISNGEVENAEIATSQIEQTQFMLNGINTSPEKRRYNIKFLQKQYKLNPNIDVGMNLIYAYMSEKRFMECQRTLVELVEMSSRLHGANHDETQGLIDILDQIKSVGTQIVRLKSDEGESKGRGYMALRYEEDGKKCIVEGPTDSNAKQTLTVESDDIIYTIGVPVTCHGLVKASHLNGKEGEVRSFDEEKQRHEILFEDESLKPCLVKPTNLRISFDV